jgi:hypothetical protein
VRESNAGAAPATVSSEPASMNATDAVRIGKADKGDDL